MLKNVDVYGTEFIDSQFPGRGETKIHLKNIEPAVLNTSFIKFVNVLKIKNTTVWKLNLVDDEILYVKPFKI
jgi:hypothetical protein